MNMTPTKDQQAQEYAKQIQKDFIHNRLVTEELAFKDIEAAWLDGYTAAEQSMWRSVEEVLPEEERLVLAAFKTDGYRTARMAIYSHDYERWISFPGTCTLSNVDFWMPIPSISDTKTEKK